MHTLFSTNKHDTSLYNVLIPAYTMVITVFLPQIKGKIKKSTLHYKIISIPKSQQLEFNFCITNKGNTYTTRFPCEYNNGITKQAFTFRMENSWTHPNRSLLVSVPRLGSAFDLPYYFQYSHKKNNVHVVFSCTYAHWMEMCEFYVVKESVSI